MIKSQTNSSAGISKESAIPAQLGENILSFTTTQKEVWYSFNSTIGTGYKIEINAPQIVNIATQVIDRNGATINHHYGGGLQSYLGMTGFTGEGIVSIIINLLNTASVGDYSFTISTVKSGMYSFYPVELDIGSTPLSIDFNQNYYYLHFDSATVDYFSFDLNISTPRVDIITTIDNGRNSYQDTYNSISNHRFNISVFDGIDFTFLFSPVVNPVDLTITLIKLVPQPGCIPSLPIDLFINTTHSLPLISQTTLFTQFTISNSNWYHLNLNNILSDTNLGYEIYDTEGQSIVSNSIHTSSESYFYAKKGNYMAIFTSDINTNILLTLNQQLPPLGYNHQFAVLLNSSKSAIFTSHSSTIYMNTTLDPLSAHLLRINTTAIGQHIRIYSPTYYQQQSDLVITGAPIYLPEGMDIAVIVLSYDAYDIYHQTFPEVRYTVSLEAIITPAYSTLDTAMSIELNKINRVTANYSNQEIWFKIYASKEQFYTTSFSTGSGTASVKYFDKTGDYLGFRKYFSGSDDYIYGRITRSVNTTFTFSFSDGSYSANLTYTYYSENFVKGDYLQYTDTVTINGQSHPEPYSSIRYTIKRDNLKFNQYEFLGYYFHREYFNQQTLPFTFWTSNPLYSQFSLTLILIPVYNTDNPTYNLTSRFQNYFPGYNITEDNQFYYFTTSYLTAYLSDISNTLVYNKINLNLVSNTITSTNRVDGYNYEISTKLVGFNYLTSLVSEKSSSLNEPPVNAKFESVSFFIALVVLPLIMKRSSRYLVEF